MKIIPLEITALNMFESYSWLFSWKSTHIDSYSPFRKPPVSIPQRPKVGQTLHLQLLCGGCKPQLFNITSWFWKIVIALWQFNIAMENDHLYSWFFPVNMVIFHSYDKLPEGKIAIGFNLNCYPRRIGKPLGSHPKMDEHLGILTGWRRSRSPVSESRRSDTCRHQWLVVLVASIDSS